MILTMESPRREQMAKREHYAFVAYELREISIYLPTSGATKSMTKLLGAPSLSAAP